MYMYMCMYIYIHIYIYMYADTYIFIYVYTCTYTFTHVCIYIYIYIYIHTHTHKSICMHVFIYMGRLFIYIGRVRRIRAPTAELVIGTCPLNSQSCVANTSAYPCGSTVCSTARADIGVTDAGGWI